LEGEDEGTSEYNQVALKLFQLYYKIGDFESAEKKFQALTSLKILSAEDYKTLAIIKTFSN